MGKVLIAFYSRADENYVGGLIKSLTIGNTEVMANFVGKLIDSDIFKIQQLHPYSKSYNECIAEAGADQKRDARPELKSYPESIDEYDTIYLGYPNYWGTMPMAVFTFLEHFDFTGKTIMPFCTHEGSGLGSSEKDIRALCPGAKVGRGIAIRGCNVESEQNTIEKWIRGSKK